MCLFLSHIQVFSCEVLIVCHLKYPYSCFWYYFYFLVYRTLLEKQERAHKWCTLMDPNIWQKQDDQHEHTYSSYVWIRNVALKTCQRRWMIGRSGERRSGISVLVARHDDDDDDSFVLVILQWILALSAEIEIHKVYSFLK